MLLPYNVDKVTRRVPWVTYGLMGANTFIFLLTVLGANLTLPNDRAEGQRVIAALVKDSPSLEQMLQSEGEGEETGGDANTVSNGFGLTASPSFRAPSFRAPSFHSPYFTSQTSGETPNVTPPADNISSSELEEASKGYRQYQAYMIAAKSLKTPDDTKRLYVIEHAYDSMVMEPHYSILNSLAYRPNNPSVLALICTMFTAMFLHGSLEHLLGNMLFLWIFGRAIEEFLGEKFYISAYLICGVAATLMQHIVTQVFAPGSMGIPNLGASGAIAGILGLFAVRFYRTKVRIFYLFGWGLWAFLIAAGIMSGIMRAITGQPLLSLIVGVVSAGAALFVLGRGNTWGAFRVPSIWMIGVWLVVANILPALWEMTQPGSGGGVAHWAHIGGLGFGALFALVIGGVDSGKDEYALEDANTALQTAGSDEAIRRAGALLQKDANNPAAHEVAARGYDRARSLELAANHYNLAIEGYWKANERDAATRLYGLAQEHHPQLRMRPALLLSLANHYAQNSLWNESAGILTRIVEEYADSPEAEIALLRAAQLWMKQYDDPAEALRMVEMFRNNYPQSQWGSQAQGVETTARALLARRSG